MATQVESDTDAGVTTLMAGIVRDARELFVEQLTLFQVEIKNDLRRTLSAMVPLAIGATVALIGAILLGIGCAHLLSWAVPEIPLWGSFAIVGGVAAVSGGLLILRGKSILNTVHAVPDTALKGLKENIQWKTKN